MKILNGTLPELVAGIGFFKKLEDGKIELPRSNKKLVQIEFSPDDKRKVSLTITDSDKKNS